jgi:hypothetical protein
MWNALVSRAKQHFGADAVGHISWEWDGESLMNRLVAGMAMADSRALHRYKLVWAPGDEELDLQRVTLKLKQRR